MSNTLEWIRVGITNFDSTIVDSSIKRHISCTIKIDISNKIFSSYRYIASSDKFRRRIHLHVRQRFCYRSDCHAHTIVRVAKSGEYAIEVDVIQLVRIGDSLAVDVAPYCRRWSPMYFVLGFAVIESIIASIGGKNLRLVGHI